MLQSALQREMKPNKIVTNKATMSTEVTTQGAQKSYMMVKIIIHDKMHNKIQHVIL